MNDIKLPKLLPCPFCGSRPWFKGDAAQWQDDSRYVELSIVCCANMTETIGWDRAREMSPSQREDELKSRLIAAWNKRTGKSNLTDEEIDAIMPWADFSDLIENYSVEQLRAACRTILAHIGTA